MQFPLPFVPTRSYKGGNGFGGSRESVRAGLRHAANDLAARPGVPVLAIDDGQVISDPYVFFRGTYAFEIRHPGFIARYCEIAAATEVRSGDLVVAGQVIAYVGDQPGRDMLHLEFFTGEGRGPFSTRPGARPPFDRRSDIFDGAHILDSLRHTVTHWNDDVNWRYRTDAAGRKFVERMDLRDI